jgi:hypothetical protein
MRPALLLLCACVGCGGSGDFHGPERDERIGVARAAISVDEAVSAGCSTSQVAGLSLQIIAQGNCIAPGAFVELSAKPNVNFGGAVLPYMEEPARDALAQALDDNPGTQMQINSMLRTVAQQYLLYRWYQLGTCGIGLAATPGNSNHETGLAIDVQQYQAWQSILEAHDFAWLGASDPVHFDYVGPGAVDHKGTDVMAFQQLWNVNNPTDVLVEDGIYGPQTEARLKQAPAEGFARGATCGEPLPPPTGDITLALAFVDADDDFDDGPSSGVSDLTVGESYTLEVTVANGGATDASDTLSFTLPDALAGDATLDIDVAAGASETFTLTIDAIGYSADQPMPLSIDAALADATATLPVDVYSQRLWTFDGDRREGWTARDGGDAIAQDGALEFDSAAIGPAIDIASESLSSIGVRAAHSGSEIELSLFSDDVEVRVPLDIPGDGNVHDVTVDVTYLQTPGTRIDAVGVTASNARLDQLSLDGGAAGAESDAACGCTLPGRRNAPSPLWLFALALLARRRRACSSS